jgi:hypothetical protein
MSVGLYMDVHVRREVTEGLRRRGVDVLVAQGDNATELDGPELLDRASELGRVLFSQDEDLLTEAASRQRSGNRFAGVVYAHPLGITIGQCIDDLELIAGVYEPDEILNRLVYCHCDSHDSRVCPTYTAASTCFVSIPR